MNLENKLPEIYNFLKENRKYNKEVQKNFYNAAILPFESTNEKVISLLYNIVNTQSQPKINSLADFFQKIHSNLDKLSSFKEFVQFLNDSDKVPANYFSLYKGLNNQKGWGNKTAALFTKSIYHIHNGEYSSNLKIWEDAPKTLADSDILHLPVDAVIIKIFEELDEEDKTQDFKSINNRLNNSKYSNYDIEIWDDLWFWGYITQKGSGENRIITYEEDWNEEEGWNEEKSWNENKYWALKESDKNSKTIDDVKKKALEFSKILEKLRTNTYS